jgi:hypothetical protein
MPWINLIIWCVVKKFSWYETDNSPSLLLVWFFVFVFLISENNSHLVKGDIFVSLISHHKRGLERPRMKKKKKNCSRFVIFMGVIGKNNNRCLVLSMFSSLSSHTIIHVWFSQCSSHRLFIFVCFYIVHHGLGTPGRLFPIFSSTAQTCTPKEVLF